jgi:hypothetical protein
MITIYAHSKKDRSLLKKSIPSAQMYMKLHDACPFDGLEKDNKVAVICV